MNIRNLAIATLFASASATSVFASQSLHWVGGELGFIEHNIPSTVTRAKVMQDYQLSLQSKVDGSGGIQLGGDAGYLEPRHSYTVADGKLRHTDSISHKAAKPEYQHSATEHVVFSETYVN